MTIFRASAVLCWRHSQSRGCPVDRPVIDRHLWIEVTEYIVAVVGVILIPWLLSEDLASPPLGGVTSLPLPRGRCWRAPLSPPPPPPPPPPLLWLSPEKCAAAAGGPRA